LRKLAEDPRSFTWLRKVAEADFVAVRRVITGALRADAETTTLDLGCGTGELSSIFSDTAYLGLDISRGYIAYARRRFPGKRFAVCDGSRLPLADESFDQTLIFGVLHHMEDPLARAVLAETARVLRPGGRLLLIEDSAEVPAWNVPGRLIHALDEGENIRSEGGYAALWGRDMLREQGRRRFRSGLCDYYAFEMIRGG
jgi:ubiquinone/menaquinone biosynthesis C-methylase UbiE